MKEGLLYAGNRIIALCMSYCQNTLSEIRRHLSLEIRKPAYNLDKGLLSQIDPLFNGNGKFHSIFAIIYFNGSTFLSTGLIHPDRK